MESPVAPNNKAGNADLTPRVARPARQATLALSLAALGVVFGDIGTSPLYAIRECFHGHYGITPSADNILGVLSLMFWSLVVIVGLKYLVFVLRADNRGEGGVLALTSLIRHLVAGLRGQVLLVALGLFGAALLYGDGMITPAISVLSAVEGLRIIAPSFEPYVIPATVAILLGLFVVQRRGTARIGALFGPIILTWLVVLALLGVVQVARHPQILAAIGPWHGIRFLVHNGLHGFVVLGAVFLVVTGAEALYADLGHFGRRPIRLAWFALAFPALLLNYFGQGAVLLFRPEESHHPFYALVPQWAMVPMVMLATSATVIAAQAVITGAFSLTRQAIQLGFLPRLRIVHTSSQHIGQIYVPFANWTLMLCTIGLVLGLESSSKLAAAYGVAVTATMMITTVLFYFVAHKLWKWRWWTAGALTTLFLVVDVAFFTSNASKLLHGAWFPLVVGGIIFVLMVTWRRGRSILAAEYKSRAISWNDFQRIIADPAIQRVAGTAIFFSSNPDVVPTSLLHNLDHNKVLHADIAVLHVTSERVPRVPNDQKVEIDKLGKGVYKIMAHYGFMESPDITNILSLAREQGVDFSLETTSFFLGRERLAFAERTHMALWRKRLFAFMSRNAMDASAFYGIPVSRVIDIGVQVQL
jgi:KUP system potassium uptake protein